MKRIIIITALFFSLATLTAAESRKVIASEPKNELGLDITLLLSNLFGWNDYYFYDYGYPYGIYNNPAGNYIISYKRYFQRSAIRFGMGGSLNNYSTDAEDAGYSSKNENSQFNFRIGYECEHPIGEKFNFYYGADIVTSISGYNMETHYVDLTNDYTSTSKSFLIGGGPVAGISWLINPRLKLTTEASLYFISGSTDTETKYEANPEWSSSAHSTSAQLVTGYPIFLNLEFKF
ncbi:MAG: hypothetical protein ACHQFW_07485 [Chitinophagales bacterium]